MIEEVTGNRIMVVNQYFITAVAALAVLLSICVPLPADELEIGVVALFEGKAIIKIDGQRRVMAVGDSAEGVTLLDANTERLILRTPRGEETFGLGVMAMPRNPELAKNLVLYADDNGFFRTRGKINGRAVNFLVDTGANTVAMSSDLAKRLGIRYRKDGQRGFADTAGGTRTMYSIQLDSLEVGGVKLNNVEAGVLEGVDPKTPLLGMSALQHMDMQRSGKRMELRQR